MALRPHGPGTPQIPRLGATRSTKDNVKGEGIQSCLESGNVIMSHSPVTGANLIPSRGDTGARGTAGPTAPRDAPSAPRTMEQSWGPITCSQALGSGEADI